MFLKGLAGDDELECHHSTYDTHQLPVENQLLDALQLENCLEDTSDLPAAIVDQLDMHLNVKTEIKDLKDSLLSEIQNNLKHYENFELGEVKSFLDLEKTRRAHPYRNRIIVLKHMLSN